MSKLSIGHRVGRNGKHESNGTIVDAVAKERAKDPAIDCLLSHITASKRAAVEDLLYAVRDRSQSGKFLFAEDKEVVGAVRRSGNANFPGLEDLHMRRVENARSTARQFGVEQAFDSLLSQYRSAFLQRRKREDTTAQAHRDREMIHDAARIGVLDSQERTSREENEWRDQAAPLASPKDLLTWVERFPFLCRRFERAAASYTAHRESEESKLPRRSRWWTKTKRFFSDLWDDVRNPQLRMKPPNYLDWQHVAGVVLQKIREKRSEAHARLFPVTGSDVCEALVAAFPQSKIEETESSTDDPFEKVAYHPRADCT
jgi:hypothetical protein